MRRREGAPGDRWRVCQSEAYKAATCPDSRVAAWAAEDWGVLSVIELEACGLNRQAIAVRVNNGRLHPKYRGVYAVGHPALTVEGEFLAAVKACGPDACLSHYSSAALDGYVRWDGRRVEVTVRGGSHREHEGIRIHRTIALPPQDCRRVRGIPTTAPARTLLDLAATLGPRSLRRAVRQAQATHRVNLREIAEVLTRFERRKGQQAPVPRRAHGRPGLPLAGPAARPRGGRRQVAQRRSGEGGRRDTPGAARVLR